MPHSTHAITAPSPQVDTLLDEIAKLEQSVEKINKLEAENGATPGINTVICEALQRSNQFQKIQEEAENILNTQGIALNNLKVIQEELLELTRGLPEAIEVPDVRSSFKHARNKIHI